MADRISRLAEGDPVTFLPMGDACLSRRTSAPSAVNGWPPDVAVNSAEAPV
jgi:hypothetical protein